MGCGFFFRECPEGERGLAALLSSPLSSQKPFESLRINKGICDGLLGGVEEDLWRLNQKYA
jgi:hypothetical protein